MGRKQKPYIKTESFVHTKEGGLVRLSDLPEKTRREIGQQLMATYMNVLYRGKAEFYVTKEE